MKNVALHNLGCKVNSYELDVMQQSLSKNGYKIVPFDQAADIYIVNTCTVTNIADRKSRQMLHRAKELNPEALVVAVGCYVETGKEALLRDAAVDLCIGNKDKARISEILRQHEKNPAVKGKEPQITSNFSNQVKLRELSEILEKTGEHTRAYVKIEDGCNQFCSYCLIPYARGRVKSRRREEILSEIGGLIANGYKEIVLTGIHISSYGLDIYGDNKAYQGESYLIDLIEDIGRLPELMRLRIGSLEPRIITGDTAKRLSMVKCLCPHFHLSLQSGCNDTLKRMNRHYTAEEYAKSVETLRRYFEHPAITTDVIVGFPGETDREFSESRAFVDAMDFYETHIFKYSKRAGTAAERLPVQVPSPIKESRSRELIGLSEAKAQAFREYYIGRTAEVLFEEKKLIDGKEYFVGHTPEYVMCGVSEVGILENEIRSVEIERILSRDTLLAKLR
ncbi:MAG: tRNA (N(6)-L-threonylcarbamoyladenosine(37)-C(2))-methylthiotransferase MtaB [Lachnospiraceae bacterium]|nr:tRNA (N(6)-L-threonylcarbamoyladenosine(37)-C(2))-methylthiotransferase MtaB [Lachnospiraceae bacterium]